MKRVSRLLWLAILVVVAGPLSSLAQNDSSLTGQLAIIQPEWGASFSRPSAQYALHRPGAGLAAIGGAPRSCVCVGEKNRLGPPIQTAVGLPLAIPKDLVIEFSREGIMDLLADGRTSKPESLHRPVLVLIVLISDSGEGRTAGNVLPCWQAIGQRSGYDAARAFRFPTQRGPTKSGGYTNRISRDLTRHYEWLSPTLR